MTTSSASKARAACAAMICTMSMLLAACGGDEETVAEPIRPVRVVTVEKREVGETVSLTGQVQAQEEVSLSFRVGGRMLERSVNVGDRVEAGQVIARIDPEPARNALQTARANLAAAMDPGSTAGVLIWENLWAAPFASAARRSGVGSTTTISAAPCTRAAIPTSRPISPPPVTTTSRPRTPSPISPPPTSAAACSSPLRQIGPRWAT